MTSVAPGPATTPGAPSSSGPVAARRRTGVGAALGPVAVVAVMAGLVVSLLLSQFGTVRGGAQPMRAVDEPVGASTGGELAEGWRPIRGRWATGAGGARVVAVGERLSVAVRPVGGVDGTIEVTGPVDTDGWAVVYRWSDPGTYGLVVLAPGSGEVSLVAVVSDRTRLLARAPLAATAGPPAAVLVELDGPVARVRVDGELVVAGREDDLDGTWAGVGLLGDETGARFARFRTGPPEGPQVRTIEPEGGG